MASELMFTSAPQGLKPGSTGYCTVMVTTGMPAPLSQRLEMLSGYEPLEGAGYTAGRPHPVSHAHWRVLVGGMTYSVLSRVCFAGADYSGRNNKFAHHVVLEPGELTPAGPAWMLRQHGIHEQSWSGVVRVIPTPRAVPQSETNIEPAACATWAKIAGDAGHAGQLVDAFILDSSKPAYIIYEPPLDLLPLLDEAIALLPQLDRWSVSFNTYFTALPPGIACTWRCCVAGTDAAKSAPANATSGVLIDLTTSGRRALMRNTRYVTFARTGRLEPAVAPIEPRAPAPAVTRTKPLPRAAPTREPTATGPYRLQSDSREAVRVVAERADDDTFDIAVAHRNRRKALTLLLWAIWPLIVLGLAGYVSIRGSGRERELVAKLDKQADEIRALDSKLSMFQLENDGSLAAKAQLQEGPDADNDSANAAEDLADTAGDIANAGVADRVPTSSDGVDAVALSDNSTNHVKQPTPSDAAGIGRGQRAAKAQAAAGGEETGKDPVESGADKSQWGAKLNLPPGAKLERKALKVSWLEQKPDDGPRRYFVRIPDGLLDSGANGNGTIIEFEGFENEPIGEVTDLLLPMPPGSSQNWRTESHDDKRVLAVWGPDQPLAKAVRQFEIEASNGQLLMRCLAGGGTRRAVAFPENSSLSLNNGRILVQFGEGPRIAALRLGGDSKVSNLPVKDVRLECWWDGSGDWKAEQESGTRKDPRQLKITLRNQKIRGSLRDKQCDGSVTLSLSTSLATWSSKGKAIEGKGIMSREFIAGEKNKLEEEKNDKDSKAKLAKDPHKERLEKQIERIQKEIEFAKDLETAWEQLSRARLYLVHVHSRALLAEIRFEWRE